MIKVSVPVVGNEEIRAVAKVLKSGYYVSGPRVKEFERMWADYVGTKYAVATNSGTSALHITLASLGIGVGDEVIVPPLSFFATVTCVIHNNAIPIFADVEPTHCIDPVDIERKITSKTKAIIPVHLYGHPAEMDAIMKIANKYNLHVIEDSAHAHGAEYKGRKVGSIGTAGCWSFYATKNITTGEGGVIATNDEKLAKKAKIIRSHGMTGHHTHEILGYNYRMNEIAGAIGIVQIRKLDRLNRLRAINSLYLMRRLRKISWLSFPPVKSYVKHSWFICSAMVDEKKLGMTTPELVAEARRRGLEFRYRYLRPLYRQPMLLKQKAYKKECPFSCPFYGKEIDYNKVFLPNAEEIAGKHIGLPNHPLLKRKDLNTVVSIIKGI